MTLLSRSRALRLNARRIIADLIPGQTLGIGVALLASLFWIAPVAAAGNSSDIPLRPEPGAASGFANFLRVKVGEDGRNGTVLMDAGSLGLRILRKYVGSDVEITDKPVTHTYAGSGNVVIGFLAYATVSFPGADGLQTPKRIAIQVVDRVTCAASRPDCPGWRDGQAGVMGIAYYGEDASERTIYNPLLQLGSPYSDAFVIDTVSDAPHIRVGALAPDMRFGFAPMKPAKYVPKGLPAAWNTWSVKVCWRLGGGEGWSCKPTLFDSGASSSRFYPRGGINPDLVHGDDHVLDKGHTVSMKVDGVFSLAIDAGTTAWDNEIKIKRSSDGQLGENAGGQIYRRFVIAFDNVAGRIGFCEPEDPFKSKRSHATPCE